MGTGDTVLEIGRLSTELHPMVTTMKATMRDRVIGVDFSGAKDAGRRIWVARGTATGDTLQIESCQPAQDLPGSGRARAESLRALGEFILAESRSAVGLDFPFSLPRALVVYDDWEWFVLGFPRDYPSPQALRAICLNAAEGRELKRVTDRQTQTPFSPYNIRLYRQTFYGIRDLLRPLVITDRARVLPMQEPAEDKPWLLEICPASTLKRAMLYAPYKGREDSHRSARNRVLAALERRAIAIQDPAVRSVILDDAGGDALDSVIAAVATFQSLGGSLPVVPRSSDRYAIEGYVYLGDPDTMRPEWDRS